LDRGQWGNEFAIDNPLLLGVLFGALSNLTKELYFSMKFLMSRTELSGLVNGLQNIVAQRTPMPILSNSIRCSGTAKVSTSGATTLPARRFAQLLKELNVSYVEVSANEKEISEIVTESASFRLHGMPKADFPVLSDLTGAQSIAVKQCDLKEALFRTAFAVSKEENRYVLTGVSLTVNKNGALFVGTDGKRMARTAITIQNEDDVSYSCIIPIKAVDEIGKNISDSKEEATLYLMADKIAVEVNDRIIMTKLLSGEYPEVERVIPQKVSTVVALHREELGTLLRQVVLFITEDKASIRFTLEDGQLHLAATTANIGEGNVSMSVNYDGPKFEIAFNPYFFLDILRHSRGEFMYMGFQDAFNPVALSDVEFKASLDPLPTPLFILMPLRLGTG
jgi:DNA polymerase-3 subunit beta